MPHLRNATITCSDITGRVPCVLGAPLRKGVCPCTVGPLGAEKAISFDNTARTGSPPALQVQASQLGGDCCPSTSSLGLGCSCASGD